MRALVIDDDAHIGLAIRAILATQQIDVIPALRAHAGMHELTVSQFGIVLVDIFMPGMGGLETIERIRARAPDIPIVAMTGFRFRDSMRPETNFLAMAMQRGADCCISKPFTPRQLIDAIDAGLHCQSARRVATIGELP
jgi:DNA-binding response OmpR family regulator